MGTVKKQKRARKEALKNRYYAGAKLSEHKFLRILLGYAEGVPIQELERTTHVSGKTIRTTYRQLRERLDGMVSDAPGMFGSAGHYLTAPKASVLLDAIAASAQFRRYRKRHAPRLKNADEETHLVLEFAVRAFCALDLRGVAAEPATVLLLLAKGTGALKARDAMQKLADLIPNAKPFAYPELRLYEDYRQSLIKNPLGMR